jgi:hypothetical protein
MTSEECSEGDSFKGTDLNRIETKKNKEKQREIKKEVLSKSDDNKTCSEGDISKPVWSEHECGPIVLPTMKTA